MSDTPKLNAALAAAQSEFPAVQFDSTNPFLKNKFASLGAVISATRPVLAKHGLAVEQMPVSVDGLIGVRTTIRHTSGETSTGFIGLPLADERGKSSAQVAGSIITYLRRYAWSSALGLYADEDTDGHAEQPQRPAQAAAPTPAPAPAPKPKAPSVFKVVTEVVGVTEKSGTSKGKKWTAYFVKFTDGTEAGTFSATIAENARALQGTPVTVATKPGSRAGTLEVVSIEPNGITP